MAAGWTLAALTPAHPLSHLLPARPARWVFFESFKRALLHHDSRREWPWRLGAWFRHHHGMNGCAQCIVQQANLSSPCCSSLLTPQVYQDYSIKVWTSTAADAAFDGDIYCTLEGEQVRASVQVTLGGVYPRPLRHSRSHDAKLHLRLHG